MPKTDQSPLHKFSPFKATNSSFADSEERDLWGDRKMLSGWPLEVQWQIHLAL